MKNLFEICGAGYGNLEKLKTKQQKLRRFAGFAYDVMPAGCGLDFEGILSPQSTAITERKTHKLVTVSLADKHR